MLGGAMNWLTENWYIAWGVLCGGGILVGGFFFRRNPDAAGAKAFFWLFPRFDPNYKLSRELTPLAIVLWCIGVIIVLLALLLVPGVA
jgi:hypothetical protein